MSVWVIVDSNAKPEIHKRLGPNHASLALACLESLEEMRMQAQRCGNHFGRGLKFGAA
jgi:hypothetical protein